jgi:hypothetical protein
MQERADGNLTPHPRQRRAHAEMRHQAEVRCRFGSRVMSSVSGLANCGSSRLADAMAAYTISPRGIVTPATVTSSRVNRSEAI